MNKPVSKFKPGTLTLNTYQNEVEKTDESKKIIVSLLGLVGEIGDLHSIFKKMLAHNQHPIFKQELVEEIGDILWYIASLATRHSLSLEEIAKANLIKAGQLFINGELNKFDSAYPEDERFPRKFSVVFEEKNVGEAVQVKIQINGIFVGDGLTDNAHDDDGYRYHDIFHLAYVAILGWSPVVRALLRRKRKSKEEIDRVEDGARAIFLEEAISVFVFNQAADRGYFKEIKSIDIGLLKVIKKLSANLEVKKCTAKQWQNAIFKGFAMFHLLKENRGGIINLDLDAESISYSPLPSIKSSGGKDVRRKRNNMLGSVAKRGSKDSRIKSK